MLHILYRKLWMQKSQISIVLVMSAISLMMVFAFSGMNSSYVPTVMVIDSSESELSQKYVEVLQSDENRKYKLGTEALAMRELRDGKILAVVKLPKQFEDNLKSKRPLEIVLKTTKNDADTFVVKPHLENAYAYLAGLHQTAEAIAYSAEAKGQNFKEVYDETYTKLVIANKDKNAITINYASKNEAIRNAVLLNSIIGFSLFFIAYSSVFGAMDILTERKKHTWQRLLVSPSSKMGMILANGMVSFVMGMLQVVIVYLAGQFLFGVKYGTGFIEWAVVGACFVFAMSGIGLIISAFSKSMQQIAALTSVLLTAFGMLGGCLWPLEMVTNKILLALSYATPHRYAFEAMSVLNGGKPLQTVLPLIGILLIYGIILSGIGIVKIRTQEETYN